MDEKKIYTHRVAVNAYLFREEKLLLLKRANPPQIWAPPGGRLKRDENPPEGLKREVKEESGLEIRIWGPVHVWHGEWRGNLIISIDFLCQYNGGDVRLSDEHSEHRWVNTDELRDGVPSKFDSDPGFRLHHFEQAFRFYRMFKDEF